MKYLIPAFLVSLALFSSVVGQPVSQPTAKTWFDRGVALSSEKKLSEALEAFRASSRLDARRAETHGNIGSLLLALSRPEEAVAPLREAIRLAPDRGIHRTTLCAALSSVGQHAEAIKECEEGVRLSPDSAYADVLLFRALKAAGRPTADLARLIDLSLARFQNNEELLTSAAELYFDANNYAYTVELLRQLIALKPEAAAYHGFLAEVFLRLERDEEALAEARTALKLEPANSYANYAMGLIFRELGQHEEAADAFSRVQPGNFRLRYAVYYQARSEAGRGRQTEAIKLMEGLVARFPDEFLFQEELGSLLNGESRYEDAVGPFTKARQLKPRDLHAASGLGLAYFESGQLERAIPVLEDALRIQPGNEVVTMFLNVTRARQRLFSQIDDMKRYAKENPQDADVRRKLVQALAFSRRVDEAEPYVKEIYAIRPKDLKLWAYVAVAYSTAGKWEKAMEVHLKSLEIGESASVYAGLASLYSRRGDFERASAAFKKLFELQPNSPDTMVLFGEYLMNNGKRREALETFKRSLSLKPMNGVALFNAGVLSAKLGEREAAFLYLEMLRPVRPDLAKSLARGLRLRVWG